jgi:hypothetical protein
MPCYRCGTRQTDPARGHSPWQRGVRADQQVLVCPDCQTAHDWAADLDRCGRCGSIRLIRRLGEVECRDCGQVAAPAGAVQTATGDGGVAGGDAGDGGVASGDAGSGGTAPGLAEEVVRALERVFGNSGPAGGDLRVDTYRRR